MWQNNKANWKLLEFKLEGRYLTNRNKKTTKNKVKRRTNTCVTSLSFLLKSRVGEEERQ